MSGGKESFLRRWSRRKRADDSVRREHLASGPREEGVGRDEESRNPVAAKQALPSTQSSAPLAPPLPPIETIDRGTDLRPFLAAGVPEEMTRAALRRAWSTDPAIRDFVGLSENFWDATSGGDIPGFGSLTVKEARDLLAQLTGAPEGAEEQKQGPSAASGEPQNNAHKVVDG
jgi:hypothetical protein